MNSASGWRGGIPAFLIGLALSMLGEVAAGLLLYGGPGFLPALSVILAVLFLSLAVGVMTDDGARGGAAVENARRLWLSLLFSFSLAAVFAIGWEIFRGFGALGLSQGIGLAFLVALPFYFGGRMLGHLTGLPGTRGRGRVAASALIGAAVGALVVGYLFFPNLSPTAVILLSLVAVSGGALVHGWALDEVFWVDGSERHVGSSGVIEIERWLRGNPRTAHRAVLENSRLRALVDRGGEPVTAEERAILSFVEAVLQPIADSPGPSDPTGASDLTGPIDSPRTSPVYPEVPPAPTRILSVGLGAGVLGEAMRRRLGSGTHDVLASDAAGMRLILETLEGGEGEGGSKPLGPPRVIHLDPLVFLSQATAPFTSGAADWILVDLLTLPGAPAGASLPPGAFARLRAHLRPGGLLVLFPLIELPGGPDLTTSILGVDGVFRESSLYVGGRGESPTVELPEDRGYPRFPAPSGSRGAFLVAGDGPGERWHWPESVHGFLRVPRLGGPGRAS
ncbi:MAG: hypothetical protein EA351_05700 [Gemmatimonadales bacterium]|nr:MAG: hypothetical protein EA351_05700 [Gemmatimonadales bacterium]